MSVWILATLGLYFLQTLIAPILRLTQDRSKILQTVLGNRDNLPDMTTMTGRFDRALKNMIEAMFVFIPLSLLSIILEADKSAAVLGAQIFFFSRVVYIPAYVSGIFGLRTTIWTISVIGQILLLIAILEAL